MPGRTPSSTDAGRATKRVVAASATPGIASWAIVATPASTARTSPWVSYVVRPQPTSAAKAASKTTRRLAGMGKRTPLQQRDFPFHRRAASVYGPAGHRSGLHPDRLSSEGGDRERCSHARQVPGRADPADRSLGFGPDPHARPLRPEPRRPHDHHDDPLVDE